MERPDAQPSLPADRASVDPQASPPSTDGQPPSTVRSPADTVPSRPPLPRASAAGSCSDHAVIDLPARGTAPATASTASLVGHVLGDVTIEAHIATGGMGHIYRGQQTAPRRTVAVKVMQAAESPVAAHRLRREVEVLGQLSHPHIAALYRAGEHRLGATTLPYFVMEFVPQAEPLVEYCQRRELPAIDRLRLFLDACDAIAAGHAAGIVHRDITSENLLVAPPRPAVAGSAGRATAEVGQVKVIDYGIAQITGGEASNDTAIDCQRLQGTRGSMSPEQFDGNDMAIDARSDVYSLGVVLYELLTGRPPHDLTGRTLPEAASIVRAGHVPPLAVSERGVSRPFRRDLRRIADACLATQPSQRYPDAGALAADLRCLLAGQPLASLPRRHRTAEGIRTTLPHHVQRPTLAVWLIVMLLAAGGIGGGLWWAIRSSNARRPPVALPAREPTASLLNYVGVSPDYVHASHASGVDPVIIPTRLEPLEWLKLRFDPPLTARVLEQELLPASFHLTRNGLPIDTTGLTLQFDFGNVYSCLASGLEELTSAPGHYALSVTEPIPPTAKENGRTPVTTPLYAWDMPAFSRFRFQLNDDHWQDNVVSMTGVERGRGMHGDIPITFLRPQTLSEEGVIVMRFSADFPIQSAWIRVKFAVWASVARPFATRGEHFLREGNEQAPIDPGASIDLDVSADGQDWTQIDHLGYGHAGIAFNPHDISQLVRGSREVWVRARLKASRTWADEGIVFTQFLRTDRDETGPAFELDLTGPAVSPARP